MNEIPKRLPTRTADRSLTGMFGPVTCIIQLAMRFDRPLDEQRFGKTVSLTMDAEPILGCRFVSKKIRPYFEKVDIESFNIFTYTEKKKEYNAFKHETMDFFNGPQMEVCLYLNSLRDNLLLKISHLVCDAAGVKDIASILSTMYNHLEEEPEFFPNPNLEDFRGFWQIVKHIPWYAIPRIVLNYLVEIYTSSIPGQSHVVQIKNASNSQFFITGTPFFWDICRKGF